MVTDKVTMSEIRGLNVGQVAIYTLPDKKAKKSTDVKFCQVRDLEEGRFDFERLSEDELRNMLGQDFDTVIPDWSLTMAYRCTKNEIENK